MAAKKSKKYLVLYPEYATAGNALSDSWHTLDIVTATSPEEAIASIDGADEDLKQVDARWAVVELGGNPQFFKVNPVLVEEK